MEEVIKGKKEGRQIEFFLLPPLKDPDSQGEYQCCAGTYTYTGE